MMRFRGRLMNRPAFARAGTFAMVVAALAMSGATRGFAADNSYDPPAGSRWTAETEARGEVIPRGGTATSLIRTRAELTIEEKTADGFRVSYVQREATVDGNARSVPLRRAYMKVLENVVIHLSTDPSGRPLHVDNLDEAKERARN